VRGVRAVQTGKDPLYSAAPVKGGRDDVIRILAAAIALGALCPVFPDSVARADERQLHSYINGRHILISRRDGGAVYGST